VQLLESLAGVLAKPANGANGQAGLGSLITTDARTGQPVLQLPLPPPDVLQRGVAALQAILQSWGAK
jgi:hypothetical protein